MDREIRMSLELRISHTSSRHEKALVDILVPDWSQGS